MWNMKKWYSFYSSYEGIDEAIINIDKEIDTESLQLKQLGKKTTDSRTNEKLHQVGAEMIFPNIFAYVPWRHHVEIITRCISVTETLFGIQFAN